MHTHTHAHLEAINIMTGESLARAEIVRAEREREPIHRRSITQGFRHAKRVPRSRRDTTRAKNRRDAHGERARKRARH